MPTYEFENNILTKQIYGEIEIKADSGNKMQLSGWVSTPSADLADEVVEADAFKEHWGKYIANPVYCWMHDREKPIGKVITPELSDRGVYLREVTLSNIPLVRETLWPLVKDGALKQQSIGFLSLKGKYEGGFYRHKEVYLLETSLVTVACNPDAVIDVVKNFGNYTNLDDVVADYYSGKLDLENPRKKNFYMHTPEKKDMPENTNIKLIEVIELNDDHRNSYYAGDDASAVSGPYKAQKDYDAKMGLVHLAKTASGKYSMPLGTLNSKGFSYSWDKVASTMCRVLGAKASPFGNEPDEKVKAYGRIFEAYTKLEKPIPVVKIEDETLPMDLVTDEVLGSVAYKDVEFKADEDFLFAKSVLTSDLESISNTLKNFKKNDTVTKEITGEVAKYIYAYLEIMGCILDEEDIATVNRLLAALYADPEEADDTPSAYDPTKDANLQKLKQSFLDEIKFWDDTE